MKNWFLERLKERSTYIGFSLLLGSFGIVLDPAQLEIMVAAVGAVSGAIMTATKDKGD